MTDSENTQVALFLARIYVLDRQHLLCCLADFSCASHRVGSANKSHYWFDLASVILEHGKILRSYGNALIDPNCLASPQTVGNQRIRLRFLLFGHQLSRSC